MLLRVYQSSAVRAHDALAATTAYGGARARAACAGMRARDVLGMVFQHYLNSILSSHQ